MDYPKWLAYATGVLETKYSDIKLVDAPAMKLNEEAVINDVTKFNPDLLILESNFSSLKNDIQVAHALKGSASGVTTVLVGPPASQCADDILKEEGVDIVARFEYDFTLLEIADALDKNMDFDHIKGISFKKNGDTIQTPNRDFTSSDDLDRMPFVSEVYKKHLNINDYYLSQSLFPQVQIFTGRGCPNRCTFCSWPETLMGRKYRVRSIDNVLDEFEYIINALPEVKEIFLEDDTFTVDKKRIRDFCDEMKERDIKIAWSCNARATLDYETMRKMKDAGCRLLIVGYESGSDEMLTAIKKGVSTDQMRKFTRDAKRARLMLHGDFIVGLPGETVETAEKTLKFIKELKPNILQVAVASPIPGTEFYNFVREHNYLLVDGLEESIDENGYQRCIISYPEFTEEKIEAYVKRALKEYYLSLAFVPVATSNILRKNGMHELRGMMTAARAFLRYLRT